jgi:hypothetical protein
MFKSPAMLFGFLLVGALSTSAQTNGRATMASPPPIEPSNLSIVPTASVTRSLDLDLTAAGVFLGEKKNRPRGSAVLGIGDIAEVELSTIPMVSSLKSLNHLSGTPGGSLKIAFPVYRYWQGLGVGFRRSGTLTETILGQDGVPLTYKGKGQPVLRRRNIGQLPWI